MLILPLIDSRILFHLLVFPVLNYTVEKGTIGVRNKRRNTMADWSEKFADAWLTIRTKAGACAANTDLEELKAAVQLGQKRV